MIRAFNHIKAKSFSVTVKQIHCIDQALEVELRHFLDGYPLQTSKFESGLASNIKILVSKLAIFGPVDKNATVPDPTKKQCK